MQAGSLTDRIWFYEPYTLKTETGSEINEYRKAFTCKAYVNSEVGVKDNLNGDVAFIHTVTFQIRKFYKFDELHRIEWNGKMYMIISIDKDKVKQLISIKTTLIND